MIRYFQYFTLNYKVLYIIFVLLLNPNMMITKNKRLLGIILTVVLLLMIPLIAMQFTNEVKWSFPDFIVAAVLLLGTGLMCEFVTSKER